MNTYPRTEAFDMELPDRPGPKIQYRRPWIRRVGIVVAIAVIVAIVVPLAVILPRRKGPQPLPSSVMFPLYINPNTNGWDPLYKAINSTTSLNFVVIINPDSGPGPGDIPDANYVTAIKTLNNFQNVRVIGYVHTTYATRDINLVFADIAKYSAWPSKGNGLHVDGIFFDEAPHVYTNVSADYMSRADSAVKAASGIQHDKTVIHNPGVPPDAGLNSTNTDIVIAFEETFSTYQNRQSALTSLPSDRSHYGFIMHSVPSSVNMNDLVFDMAQHAAYLFVTQLDTNYYENFGPDWSTFVKAMPS